MSSYPKSDGATYTDHHYFGVLNWIEGKGQLDLSSLRLKIGPKE